MLSTSEYYSIHNIPVRIWENETRYLKYWARDAYYGAGMSAQVLWGSGVLEPWTDPYYNSVSADNWARPATTMSLEDVAFVSRADENGKSPATVGGDMVEAKWPGGTLKYTMRSKDLKLKVYTTEQGSGYDALRIAYSGTTVGPNMYISCAVKDADTGALYYYGKLADCSKSGSGTAEIRNPGLRFTPVNVIIEVFSEQTNGDLYTDFCSEPVILKAERKSGQWRVVDTNGETHTHQWDQDNWTTDDYNHWHDCKAANCPFRESNDLKDGYDWHRYDQKVVTWDYLYDGPKYESPALYLYSCVCGKAGTETFTVGEARHNWSSCVQIEGDKHRRKCWDCNLEDISPCYGGEATCTSGPVCVKCGNEYGQPDPVGVAADRQRRCLAGPAEKDAGKVSVIFVVELDRPHLA